jgi:hypothetical protein
MSKIFLSYTESKKRQTLFAWHESKAPRHRHRFNSSSLTLFPDHIKTPCTSPNKHQHTYKTSPSTYYICQSFPLSCPASSHEFLQEKPGHFPPLFVHKQTQRVRRDHLCCKLQKKPTRATRPGCRFTSKTSTNFVRTANTPISSAQVKVKTQTPRARELQTEYHSQPLNQIDRFNQWQELLPKELQIRQGHLSTSNLCQEAKVKAICRFQYEGKHLLYCFLFVFG